MDEIVQLTRTLNAYGIDVGLKITYDIKLGSTLVSFFKKEEQIFSWWIDGFEIPKRHIQQITIRLCLMLNKHYPNNYHVKGEWDE